MNFFDPNVHSSDLFAMGSPGHLALGLGLFVGLALLLVFKRQLPALRNSRAFMAGAAGFVLGLEAISYALKFIYPCDPAWERLPLHLCASLKIAITVLVLARRYEWLKYLSVLAIGCGFISFANLNLHGESFGNFAWWHYVIGHYFLFLAPIFLLLTGDTYDTKTHLRMCAGLAGWSFTVFLINWAFDTNYMYSGPHNDTVVPFLPDSWMAWPFNYVSYVGIALVLLNVTYGIIRVVTKKESAAEALPAALPVTTS